MKKIFILFPLIFIFSLFFSSVTFAATGSSDSGLEQEPLYPMSAYNDVCYFLVGVAVNQYYIDTGSAEEVFVYARTSMYNADDYRRLDIWVGPRSSSPGNGGDPLNWTCVDGIRRYYVYGSSAADVGIQFKSVVDSVTLSTTETEKYRRAYISQDVYDDLGVLYFKSPNPLYPPVVDVPEFDFEFSIYDKFQDFYNQSHEFNDAAHKLTVTENSNNPNDGVFQSLLVNLSDLQHTGNSIMQQMSNQMQNFSENFFGNFAQYSLGLLSDIKDGIGNLVDNAMPDNLQNIIDAVYSSGLDADGNFGLDTFFDYWFIPEEDYFGTIFNQLSSDRTGLFQIFDIMDYMKSGLLSLEPIAPVIRIPGGTYGFLTIPDIELGFTWFEAWKTYTDPLIASFLYVTYAWHLILQIPGILSGGAGTVASGNHYESNEIRRENNERLRGR